MSLSCNCDWDYDFELGDWSYDIILNEIDFEALNTYRAKRCCSCNKLIKVGSLCVKYPRARYPYDELESRKKLSQDLEDAFNQEPLIPIADHYHCERCGEIWLNLTELGYDCLAPNENMEDSLKEYHELSGWKPEC